MDKNLFIKEASFKELDAIMDIICEARETIRSLGIDQWQDGYPQREIIENDIKTGVSFCIENKESGEVLATVCVFESGEPLYDKIYDGEWLTGKSPSELLDKTNYTAVHRVAISVRARGQGLSTAIIDFVAQKARKIGKRSIRIDTHEGNVVMRKMLEKHGFVHCGTIFLESGDSRVAYEKVL